MRFYLKWEPGCTDRESGMAVTLHLEWRLFFTEIDLASQSSHDIANRSRCIGCLINSTDFLSSMDSSRLIGS